jgi:TIR domain/HEAT repeats
MSHIFISCSNADKIRAKELYDRLNSNFGSWLFTEKLPGGTRWSLEIDEALSKASALLVLISTSSVVSQWVTYEWSFALGRNTPVIPLQIEDVERNKIHDKLKELQIIPFIDPSDNDWTKLLERVEELSLEGKIKRLISLDEIIKSSKDYWERKMAIRELTEISDPTRVNMFIPTVIQALKSDPEFMVRLEAAETLGKLKAKVAVTALIEALRDNQSSVRGPAAVALGQIGDKRAVAELIRSLYDEEYVRERAAEALGELRDTRAIPELVKILNDRSASVRYYTVEALGKFGEDAKSAVPELIQLLSDFEIIHSDVRVCDTAADTLRKIRVEDGLEAVRQWEQNS